MVVKITVQIFLAKVAWIVNNGMVNMGEMIKLNYEGLSKPSWSSVQVDLIAESGSAEMHSCTHLNP